MQIFIEKNLLWLILSTIFKNNNSYLVFSRITWDLSGWDDTKIFSHIWRESTHIFMTFWPQVTHNINTFNTNLCHYYNKLTFKFTFFTNYFNWLFSFIWYYNDFVFVYSNKNDKKLHNLYCHFFICIIFVFSKKKIIIIIILYLSSFKHWNFYWIIKRIYD
jgi:hypothetical protein